MFAANNFNRVITRYVFGLDTKMIQNYTILFAEHRMVAGKKEELEKELKEKKEMWELRLKSIDKQEELLKKRMAELQKEAMAEMSGVKDE